MCSPHAPPTRRRCDRALPKRRLPARIAPLSSSIRPSIDHSTNRSHITTPSSKRARTERHTLSTLQPPSLLVPLVAARRRRSSPLVAPHPLIPTPRSSPLVLMQLVRPGPLLSSLSVRLPPTQNTRSTHAHCSSTHHWSTPWVRGESSHATRPFSWPAVCSAA